MVLSSAPPHGIGDPPGADPISALWAAAVILAVGLLAALAARRSRR